MVITCAFEKMTDKECNKKKWNHAYVMGLNTIGDGSWGDKTVVEMVFRLWEKMAQSRIT